MKTLPGYRTLRRIDKGGMTELFVARDPDDDPVVVRWIQERHVSDRKVQKCFKQGIMVLADLDHPNIVELYDHGKHKGDRYMVIAYHENLNLRERISKRDEILQYNQLSLLVQLASALDYMHQEGYLHMDLKPENILIREDLHLILVDFDLALKHKGKTQRLKEVAGTPNYLSPETLREGKVDERSEVFCFGACAYELLTYQKPFVASDPAGYSRILRSAGTEATPITTHRPDLDRGLGDIIMKCLAKNPAARYPSMSLVRHNLTAIG